MPGISIVGMKFGSLTMSGNIKETKMTTYKTFTKELLKDLAKESDSQKMKTRIEQELCVVYGDVLKDFTAEEIDTLVSVIRSNIELGPIVEKTADAVSKRILARPTNVRWLADKAFDFAVGALATGTALWISRNLSVKNGKTSNNPFADSSASSVARNKTVRNVAPFETKAS
jgi:hypothetical protein